MGRAAELAQSVEQIFSELEQAMGRFRAAANLGCPPGCGACCHHPDIEATVLEFLPLAQSLLRQGRAEPLLAGPPRSDGLCPLFEAGLSPHQGRCTAYAHRGLICRLFGFSTTPDKAGRPRLAACRRLLAEQSQRIADAQEAVDAGLEAPSMPAFGHRLALLDPTQGTERLPIRVAIHRALQRVLLEAQLEAQSDQAG